MRTQSAATRAVGYAVGYGITLCTVFCGATALACMDYRPRPSGLVRDVLSDDPAVAKAAAEKLRAMGPEALGVLMDVYAREIQRNTGRRSVARPVYGPRVFQAACAEDAPGAARAQDVRAARPDAAEVWRRLTAAIDTVAAQKDAAHAGLYWHADLEKAKAAARESGKPILSLRLLGTLDTEFSCANSRFFRTVLYANDEVSAALRDRFILHWQSVRPVPKVTIDMGDGRVVHRTITGNSAHYVLDPNGRPLDAIAGLYGPKAFLRAVADAEQLAQSLAKVNDPSSRQALLREWHRDRAARLAARWEKDVRAVGFDGASPSAPVPPTPKSGQRAAPTALDATRVAPSKSAAEVTIVRSLEPRSAVLPESASEELWARLAALPAHAADAELDDGSRALVRAKHPAAAQAGRLSTAKRQSEDPLLRVLINLQRSISEDTVRNEYTFHRTVHQWFASGTSETLAADVAPLNEKVYAELFLTPSSDPWLGLIPADTYSALEGEGIVAGVK